MVDSIAKANKYEMVGFLLEIDGKKKRGGVVNNRNKRNSFYSISKWFWASFCQKSKSVGIYNVYVVHVISMYVMHIRRCISCISMHITCSSSLHLSLTICTLESQIRTCIIVPCYLIPCTIRTLLPFLHFLLPFLHLCIL